jgi:hypothetical protein
LTDEKIFRPYGTLLLKYNFYATNILSLWDSPVKDLIWVETKSKRHAQKCPVGTIYIEIQVY